MSTTTVNELFETINMDRLEKIFRFETYRITNKHDKEDIRQSALMNIWRSLSNYSKEDLPPEKITSFAQTIVRRTVMDFLRSKSKFTNKFTTGSTDDVMQVDEFGDTCTPYDREDSSAGAVLAISDVKMDYLNNKQVFTKGEQKVIERLLFDSEGSGKSMVDVTNELGYNKSLASHATNKLRSVCRP